MALNVFIGHDSAYPTVSEVCAFSMKTRSSIDFELNFLRLQELSSTGQYWREADPLASTEFTYLRYLVPFLCDYSGLALYCDNDFLWQDGVHHLLAERAGESALCCVQHDHRPVETVKMDGKLQTVFPRKNWSSLMLFDCRHPAHKALTPHIVSTAPAAYLHQLQWLEDEQIGNLSNRWNWLEGWYSDQPDVRLGAIHFTRGGPWLESEQQFGFADLWRNEHRRWSDATETRSQAGVESN